MSPDAPTRASLLAEVRRLESALARAQGALRALGGETVPGGHLLVEAAGRRALLPAARVVEVVRLVAFTPLPDAPPHVLGSFVCRGAPVCAMDLAALLGAPREPSLDAQIAVIAGVPAVGLVVDRVERLVESPRLLEGDVTAGTPEAWRGSTLVAGLCVEQGEVLPLLDPAPLLAAVAGSGG